MIQQMLAIWSLVPLPFLKPAWTSGSSWFMYCWLGEAWLGEFWALLYQHVRWVQLCGKFEHSLGLPFLGTGMKTDLFQSCGHCWVFQICWRIECSTFTASSFRIWNSSTGIPSHPLALFVVMLSKAHLTSHRLYPLGVKMEDSSLWESDQQIEKNQRTGFGGFHGDCPVGLSYRKHCVLWAQNLQLILWCSVIIPEHTSGPWASQENSSHERPRQIEKPPMTNAQSWMLRDDNTYETRTKFYLKTQKEFLKIKNTTVEMKIQKRGWKTKLRRSSKE